MDPTSLPTDNLYKFMALSGVAIVGFFIWFVWKTQREIRGLLTEIEIRKARNEVAQERLNHLLTISDMKAEQRNAKLDRLNAIRNSGAATDDDLETARKLDEEYKIADREAIAALQETYPVKQEQAELIALAESLRTQTTIFKNLKRKYDIAMYMGLAWSLAGVRALVLETPNAARREAKLGERGSRH